ncbi:Tn3 family transposase [Nocardia sp. NBC_01730]|uniref:Tn3 family transposase n=1 Tax=Nocardia sp. NBC_01730 TaxID=2975998 RepID=UPI002E0D63BD|nr:Tn3 family transposase [Nocardia sp. NBC_01730]
MLPEIDLCELVLEVMSWVPGFTEAFTHASGNHARVADLRLSVAGVLCANAMNVGFKPVTSPGVPGLTRDPGTYPPSGRRTCLCRCGLRSRSHGMCSSQPTPEWADP